MVLADILDKPVCFWRRNRVPTSFQSENMRSLLPTERKCVDLAYQLLIRLNAEENRRFDAWTRKAGTMLTASGLMLSLCSLGVPRLDQLHTKGEITYFLAIAVIITGVGAFFLSTLNALVSIRARPLCSVAMDVVCSEDNKPSDATLLVEELTASELCAYRNNELIVNEKATKVNQAYNWFFVGCVLETSFVLLVILTMA